MTGIRDKINAPIKIIQIFATPIKARSYHRVQRNVVMKAELELNKDDKADKKGRPKR